MNTLFKTILVAAFLTSAGATFAQDTGFGPGSPGFGKGGPGGQRGMQGMPGIERMVRAIHRLDLSDEQRESIQAVMQDTREEVEPIMGQVKAGHLQLKELVKAAEYDEAAVEALAEKEGVLAAERMMITSRALSEIYGYLTEEQRAELDVMAAERMQRRSERRKYRTG